MDYHYYVFSEEIFNEEIGHYVSYGIGVADDKNQFDIKKISDVSTNKDAILRLVFLCNELELSIIQLNDVVEDFIVSAGEIYKNLRSA